jgi:ribosomal protein L35AE/L33A
VSFLRIAVLAAVMSAVTACGGGADVTQNATAAAPSSAQAEVPPQTVMSSIALSAPSYSVAQGDGSVTVQVQRTGPAQDAVSVDYATIDGTGVAGTDYTPVSGTLEWAENDATAKTVTIPVNGATPFSGDKTFDVVLANPSDALSLANPGTATVLISGAATAAAGSLQFAAKSYSVSQNAGSLTVTVTRTGGSSGAVSASYSTANGSATAGKDFTATSGTVEWADGDALAKTFTLPISNQAAFSGNKTLSLSLTSSSAQIGDQGSASVVITGASSASVGSFQLSKASYSVPQSAGTLVISVGRVGGASGPASVSYQTANGSAVAGTDYTKSAGTLNWNDGDAAAKTFTIAVSNATPFSGNKTLTVALLNPSTLASVISPGTASVTIVGSAAAPSGTLALAASSYSVAQNAGAIAITVARTGGSHGAASVTYKTVNGSAVGGTDFTAANGSLTWADGDSGNKTFSVAVSNATPFSGSKTFSVSLSGSSGASVGSPGSATVKINGDAQTAVGNVQLSTSAYNVNQSAKSLTVTVNRTGGSSGAVGVSYTTNNGTALAGTDYTPVSGTLQWSNGDAAAKTFVVPVSNAAAFSGSKTFSVAISGPTGGASLSNPSTATATINGAGGSSTPPSGVTWMYLNGAKTLAGDFTGQGNTTDYYHSTSSGYNGGTKDILISDPGAWGYFIPYWAANYMLPNPGYQYLLMSIKPTITGDTFSIHAERVGDAGLPPIELMNYGPPAVAGQWTSYVIPLKDLGVYGDATLYKVVLQTHTGGADSWEMDAIGFK